VIRAGRGASQLRRQLAEVERAKVDAAKLSQQGGQSLYLHGRADRAEIWERTALALTESGFAVVPGRARGRLDTHRLSESRWVSSGGVRPPAASEDGAVRQQAEIVRSAQD
jgi:alpha-beta hydrolase superfamily lysophospholipase